MADLGAVALAMPETTREVSEDGRPTYNSQGKVWLER